MLLFVLVESFFIVYLKPLGRRIVTTKKTVTSRIVHIFIFYHQFRDIWGCCSIKLHLEFSDWLNCSNRKSSVCVYHSPFDNTILYTQTIYKVNLENFLLFEHLKGVTRKLPQSAILRKSYRVKIDQRPFLSESYRCPPFDLVQLIRVFRLSLNALYKIYIQTQKLS